MNTIFSLLSLFRKEEKEQDLQMDSSNYNRGGGSRGGRGGGARGGRDGGARGGRGGVRGHGVVGAHGGGGSRGGRGGGRHGSLGGRGGGHDGAGTHGGHGGGRNGGATRGGPGGGRDGRGGGPNGGAAFGSRGGWGGSGSRGGWGGSGSRGGWGGSGSHSGGGGGATGSHGGGFHGTDASNESALSSGKDSKTLKIMSYNVWFNEDLELLNRMKAIGDLIHLHSPDIICFQEVTPNIYRVFQQSHWWRSYKCSVSSGMAITRRYFCMQLSKLPVKSFMTKPFNYSVMGRELCGAEVEVQENMSLVVATSHLESPCPAPPKWDQMHSKERVDQAKEAVNFLTGNRNVIFCGDLNWDDILDGEFPISGGWFDAWSELRPSEDGWTYDTKSNHMLTGNRTIQKRLDRFLCSLRDFRVDGIEMVGTKAIPGIFFVKQKGGKTFELPVFPSDHFGLLLTIRRRDGH